MYMHICTYVQTYMIYIKIHRDNIKLEASKFGTQTLFLLIQIEKTFSLSLSLSILFSLSLPLASFLNNYKKTNNKAC